MIAGGSIAFANARVRALKSRLLGREIAGRLSAGLAITRDESTDPAAGFHELLEWYGIVLRSYPYGRPLLLALVGRFEIENIKLVWRAAANRHDPSRWVGLWLPLESLATVTLESCRDTRTLQAVVQALRLTPYATVAAEMWRAHAGDPLAAEMGFDRWASRRIVDAAEALPAADTTTVALAQAVVHEREYNILRRATRAGLSPEIQRRRARRGLCRRAFRESPFCLAPAVALLLLKEEEVRGLEAVALGRDDEDRAAFDYVLAASELGA